MTSAPITADAATIKTLGVGKSFTVSGKKVTKLDSKEKKVVSVSIKKGKVTVKGKKAGKVSFKIGKETYKVNVGATKVTATAAATTLKVNDTTKVSITAKYGANDKLTIKTSKSSVVKIGKSSVTADKNGKASVTLRGLAAGTSTITVKSANTGMYAKVKITVKADETATAAPSSDAPATLAPATDAPVGPTVVPTSGGAVTTAPTSGGAVTAAPTATPTTVSELQVVTASAISTNKIAFTFNKTVTASAINAADIVITETDGRVFAKSVTADEKDKNTVIIELFDSMVSKKEYTVTVPVDKKSYTQKLSFVQGTAAKIVVANQKVQAGTPSEIKYQVVDANGMDITSSVAANVSFESTIETADKKITLADKQVAFVKVVVTENGSSVKSEQFTITGEAAKPAQISNYTVAEGNSTITYTAADYKQSTTVSITDKTKKLFVETKDQFGTANSNPTVTYESQDSSVLVIDKTTGVIIPIKKGTAPVKITAGDITKTIQLTVVDEAVATTLHVEKTSVTVNPALSGYNGTTVTVYVKDQYGNKMADQAITVKSNDETKATAVIDKNGVDRVVTISGLTKGSAVITITCGELKSAISVDLKESGATASYKCEGAVSSLDKKNDTVKDKMKLKVYGIDTEGNRATVDQEFTYSLKDSKGESMLDAQYDATNGYKTASTATISIDAVASQQKALKVGDTYTVSVKLGSYEVTSFKFKVVDSRVAPSVVLAKTKATIGADKLTNTNALAAQLQAVDALHVDSKNVTLSDLKFVSADGTILEEGNAKALTAHAGTVKLSLLGVTATVTETINDAPVVTSFDISLTGTIDLTVAPVVEATTAGDVNTNADLFGESSTTKKYDLVESSYENGVLNVDIYTNYTLDDFNNENEATRAANKLNLTFVGTAGMNYAWPSRNNDGTPCTDEARNYTNEALITGGAATDKDTDITIEVPVYALYRDPAETGVGDDASNASTSRSNDNTRLFYRKDGTVIKVKFNVYIRSSLSASKAEYVRIDSKSSTGWTKITGDTKTITKENPSA